jgi:hypothetical protein
MLSGMTTVADFAPRQNRVKASPFAADCRAPARRLYRAAIGLSATAKKP